ncbi:hypothetical protein DM02DRAFT_620433, partial [Periconia macrospinosa]
YKLGKIGSHRVTMCCLTCEYESTSVAVDMMRSFPLIKLLILVSSNAGAVPRDVGQVH